MFHNLLTLNANKCKHFSYYPNKRLFINHYDFNNHRFNIVVEIRIGVHLDFLKLVRFHFPIVLPKPFGKSTYHYYMYNNIYFSDINFTLSYFLTISLTFDYFFIAFGSMFLFNILHYLIVTLYFLGSVLLYVCKRYVKNIQAFYFHHLL